MDNIVLNASNPDSGSIVNKEQIDISLSTFDISASGYFGKIQTNYSVNIQTVYLPEDDFINSSSYYTPLYKEKLDYNVWVSRIDRNFNELT